MIELSVPCNGCTLCCQGDALRLLPGDDASQYQTVPHDTILGELMLDHKPNGDCIYLGATGCTIHARRPQMCREMDCRIIGARLSWTQAHKLNVVRVWRRGRELSKLGSDEHR